MTWSESQRRNDWPPQRKSREDLAEAAVEEIVELRDDRTRVFKSREGTLLVNAHVAPIHYRTSAGWAEIDNTLHAHPRRPGVFSTNGNTWNASFGPPGEGVARTVAADIAFGERVILAPASIGVGLGGANRGNC